MLDAHVYLGRPVIPATLTDEIGDDESTRAVADGVYGRFPQEVLDRQREIVGNVANVADDADFERLVNSMRNAQRMYAKTRNEPSKRSSRRTKDIRPQVHPLFLGSAGASIESARALADLSSFRPNRTIFEANVTTSLNKNTDATRTALKMLEKRHHHDRLIRMNRERRTEDDDEGEDDAADDDSSSKRRRRRASSKIVNTPKKVSTEKKRLSKKERRMLRKSGGATTSSARPPSSQQLPSSPSKKSFKDERHYVSYEPRGVNVEQDAHLRVNANRDATDSMFLAEANLDLNPDDLEGLVAKKRSYHWDKRKGNYVKASLEEHSKAGRIRNEAGVVVNVKNRGEIYEKWRKKSNKTIGFEIGGDDDDGGARALSDRVDVEVGRDSTDVGKIAHANRARSKRAKDAHKERHRLGKKGPTSELKSKEEVARARKEQDKNRLKQMSKKDRRQEVSRRDEKKAQTAKGIAKAKRVGKRSSQRELKRAYDLGATHKNSRSRIVRVGAKKRKRS